MTSEHCTETRHCCSLVDEVVDADPEEVMIIARRNAEKWRGTLNLLAKYDQGEWNPPEAG